MVKSEAYTGVKYNVKYYTHRHWHGLSLDEPYEFDYLPKDRPYNEERYKKFIGTHFLDSSMYQT